MQERVLTCDNLKARISSMKIKKSNQIGLTLTLQGVSDHIGIPRRTLYDMIKDGRFPIDPIPELHPRRWNIEDVDAWRFKKK